MKKLFSFSKSPERDDMPSRNKKELYVGTIQEKTATETMRKLNLATQADQKQDRDIVCSEIFADITGKLNEAARESTNHAYGRWYEVLAPYFCSNIDKGEALLLTCKRLWGQPFTAPIFALLLHQWLLTHPDAGGSDERLKHINIMVSGSRQLFLGDVETSSVAFEPLFSFIENNMDIAYESLIALCAAFLPYYAQSDEDFIAALDRFHSIGGEDVVDFAICKIVDALSKDIRADEACMKYLHRLSSIEKYIKILRTSTRIRLQGTIYSLTQSGGPRYASRKVNKLAFSTLDVLFPHGKRTRRAINFGFRGLFVFSECMPLISRIYALYFSWIVGCCSFLSRLFSRTFSTSWITRNKQGSSKQRKVNE